MTRSHSGSGEKRRFRKLKTVKSLQTFPPFIFSLQSLFVRIIVRDVNGSSLLREFVGWWIYGQCEKGYMYFFSSPHGFTDETVDLNPFLVRTEGAVALDALIVPKQSSTT